MSDRIDPNEFIITRKRKKYKFAKFANADNCYEFDEWHRRPVDCIEIGAGTGIFSVEMAALHTDRTFVALDVKADRLQKGAYIALDRGITNVLFVRARTDQIAEMFEPASLSTIWLTFPDPHPKKRAAGRRLTHPHFLELYKNLLKSDGALNFKHDDTDFFHWSLEQFVNDGWGLDELSFDLHESELDGEYKILTDYEQRWLGEGRITNLVRAKKPL